MHVAKHYTELIAQARLIEKDGDLEKAATLYEQAIKQEPLLEHPYQRLMVIYRKHKNYKDELRVLNKAIEVFKAYYDKKAEPFTGRGKLAQVSQALLKSVTGNEKKHSYTSYPEPIPAWTIRKLNVEKKIK